MKEQSASGILGTSIEKIKDLVDVSTIIGDPMDLGDGIKIIPVSKVSYGFASGGSDFPVEVKRRALRRRRRSRHHHHSYRIHRCQQRRGQHQTYLDRGSSIERTIGMIPDVVNSVTDVVNKFVDGKGKKTEENLEGLY